MLLHELTRSPALRHSHFILATCACGFGGLCGAIINVINTLDTVSDLCTIERYLVTVIKTRSIQSLRMISNTNRRK